MAGAKCKRTGCDALRTRPTAVVKITVFMESVEGYPAVARCQMHAAGGREALPGRSANDGGRGALRRGRAVASCGWGCFCGIGDARSLYLRDKCPVRRDQTCAPGRAGARPYRSAPETAWGSCQPPPGSEASPHASMSSTSRSGSRPVASILLIVWKFSGFV
jgi:hypothetical protein